LAYSNRTKSFYAELAVFHQRTLQVSSPFVTIVQWFPTF
jgi:hypothetical protein